MESVVELYQIVHTLDGSILHLEAHVELLRHSYYELFRGGRPLVVSEIRAEIDSVIKLRRPPRGVSLFVRLSLRQGGELRIQCDELSLYRGYTLRCIHPKAIPIIYNLPNLDYSTTVRDSVVAMVKLEAERQLCDIALHSDGNSVDMAGGAQLIALRGHEVITSSRSLSVEHGLVLEALKVVGTKVVHRPIRVDELPHLDELFFADHYGITALRGSAGGGYYTSLFAERVANNMRM